MDRWEHQTIIEMNKNCLLNLTLGESAGTPKSYPCIPAVRSEYVQADDMTNGEKTEEKYSFIFITPEGAPNPTKGDTFTDEQTRLWTIIGANGGAEVYCSKWLAYLTTRTSIGQGSVKGK